MNKKRERPFDWLKPDGLWRDPEGRVLCSYCKDPIMLPYTACVNCHTSFTKQQMDAYEKWDKENRARFEAAYQENLKKAAKSPEEAT